MRVVSVAEEQRESGVTWEVPEDPAAFMSWARVLLVASRPGFLPSALRIFGAGLFFVLCP